MDPLAEFSSKSILDVASELGVRSSTVQKALRELGVSADEPTQPVDPDLVAVLLDHLQDQGVIPSKFKRLNRDPDVPAMSDDLLFEALGASEDGFSEDRIPRELRVESGFTEKPSWLQRFFGSSKANEVVRLLHESPKSEDEIERMLSPAAVRVTGKSRSPLAESASDDDGFETEEEKAQPTIELSEDILGEFDDLDMEGIEDLADIELEGFEELGKEAEAVKEASDEPEPSDKAAPEEEEEPDSEEEGESKEGDEEIEDVIPAGLFERLISRIHLTPTEMWTVTGGSLGIMVILLGVTIYWYWYKSDVANQTLWDQAEEKYRLANLPNETDSITQTMQNYGDAARLYLRFLNQFVDDPRTNEAFQKLCDSHFQKARLHDRENQTDPMIEEYRSAINFYNQFLNHLEKEANETSEFLALLPDTEEANEVRVTMLSKTFPDPDQQETAMYNRAFAHWRLGEYQDAIDSFRTYLNKFSGHDRAPNARLNIAKIYQEWAQKSKEREFELLDAAELAYNEAIDALPDDAHVEKMNLYYGLGEIKKAIFERRRQDNQREAMQNPLMEAIAYLEQAENEARAAGDELLRPELIPQRIRVFKFLGDLYLDRGELAEEELNNFERVERNFREGDLLDIMREGVRKKREETELFLNNALALYDELLEKREVIPEKLDEFELMYNKANALRYLEEFDEALETAVELDNELMTLKGEAAAGVEDRYRSVRVKNKYLLGHISWDKAQSELEQSILQNRRKPENPNRFFANVNRYYKEALLEDPYFPREQNGIISHLADIRLTNVVFMLEGDYENAISRFKNMVDIWPEDDYSYLTYYFYGKTLERYGDEIKAQRDAVLDEIKRFGINQELDQKKKNLDAQMKQLYHDAKTQYGKALEVRPTSKHVDVENERYKVEIAFNRGFAAFKQENYMNDPAQLDAETLLKQALDEFRDHPIAKEKYISTAIERLGDVYKEKGSYDKAIDYYKTYIDEAFEDPESKIRVKLADAYRTRLSFEDARLWYDRVIAENPPPTRRDRERAQRDNRTIEPGPAYEAYKKKAETYLTEAVTSAENRTEKLRRALDAYLAFAEKYPPPPPNGSPNEPAASPVYPIDVESQLKIGNIYYELEDYPKAAESLLTFLRNNPDFPEKGQVYNRIGNAYIQAGMIDEAIDNLYLVSKEDIDPPQYADLQSNLARAYETKARQFLNNGDEVQYETHLKNAIQAYNEVIQTGIAGKIESANIKRQGLLQELKNWREAQTGDGLNLGG